jgi:uncharacterized protein (DUF1810 family)
MLDPYSLQRFVEAHDRVYLQVSKELMSGHKKSHWMWFIFPQFAGLGRTPMAQRFALHTLAEARAYSDHPILAPRLTECTRRVIDIQGRSIQTIFAFPDHLKFHSSMTLFACARPDVSIFRDALIQFFDSKVDARTIELLKDAAGTD